MRINLEFPPNQANEDDGLGNAGIATYREDPYAGAARETGQNSNDAPMGRPVRITFDLLEVPFEQIPDIVSLGEAVISCLSKARAAGDEKEIAFFEQAARVLRAGPLKVLRISDSNTTGLIGPPEIPGTPFHSLVKGSGVSKKLDPASGGSFGIGKNAVYAISDLQTVFYSTLYGQARGQQFLAQGKSILVSHQGRDGVPRRPTGYWGLPGFRPISDSSRVPAWLRRHDQGTSVYALGFRETEDWEHRIASALLKNFFHAIHAGEMEFAIDDNRIVLSRANVGALFEDPEIIAAAERSDQKQSYDFSRDLFHCLTSSDAKEHETTIRGLGCVSVRVLVADGLPKKVGIIRNG